MGQHNKPSALLGVAPYDDDSGKRGRAPIRGGRRRSATHSTWLPGARPHNPALKAFYRRLIAKGKKAKVALVACMRKLIVILNIMIAAANGIQRYAVLTARTPRSAFGRAPARPTDR